MNKFWKWKKQKVINQDGGEGVERVLEIYQAAYERYLNR